MTRGEPLCSILLHPLELPMSMPVRLSEDLMELARRAANEATRSLTAQVEHWALIGRAVETALDHASLIALKGSGGKLAGVIPDAARRAAITDALLQAVRGIDRDALRRRIASGKAPLHGIERSRPDVIVRYPSAKGGVTASVHEKATRYAVAKRRKRA